MKHNRIWFWQLLAPKVKLYIFDKEKRNWTERGVPLFIQHQDKWEKIISGRGQLRLNDSAVSKPGHLKSRLVVTISPDNCLLQSNSPSSNRWEPPAIWGLFWTPSFGLIWSAKRYLITIVANIVLLSSSQLTLIFRRTRKILGYLLWTRERYACEIKAFQNWSKLFAGEDLPDCLQY